MKFEIIDQDSWPRKKTFEHFFNIAKNTYSITVKIDVTKVIEFTQKEHMKFYPVFTWIIAKAVNEHKQFKMGFNQKGQLGFYDVVHPVMDQYENVVSLTTFYDTNMKKICENMNEAITIMRRMEL